MKTSIFKCRLFLTLGLIITLCYSCKNDDHGPGSGDAALTINVTNVINGSSTIDAVKAEIEGDTDSYTAAEAQYTDNGFTLKLPATIPNEYLSLFTGDEDYMAGFSISDTTAKIASINMYAYGSGNYMGSIDYASADPFGDDSTLVESLFIYADKNVTVYGESGDDYSTQRINITLNKGWNICFSTTTLIASDEFSKVQYISTLTSQKPSGTTMYWYFSSEFGTDTPALRSAKTMQKQAFLFHKK